MRRHPKWLIITLAYTCVIVCFGVGISLHVDPLVDYHGKWMRQSEMHRQYYPLYCVPYTGTALYEEIVHVLPTVPVFACFDSNAAALMWRRQHPLSRP